MQLQFLSISHRIIQIRHPAWSPINPNFHIILLTRLKKTHSSFGRTKKRLPLQIRFFKIYSTKKGNSRPRRSSSESFWKIRVVIPRYKRARPPRKLEERCQEESNSRGVRTNVRGHFIRPPPRDSISSSRCGFFWLAPGEIKLDARDRPPRWARSSEKKEKKLTLKQCCGKIISPRRGRK